MRFASRNYVIVGLGLLQHQMHGAHVIRGMTPIATCFQIAEVQLRRQAPLNLRRSAGDLARYEFIAAPRPFVIEKNPIHAEHAVGFAIVSRQFKSGDLADAIWTAWIKRGRLTLGHFAHAAKHLGRSSEIKTALRAQLLECSQQVMRAVDVDVHRREAVLKTLGHETLRSEVIAFIKLVLAEDVKDARIAFNARRMKLKTIKQVRDAAKSSLRVFDPDAPHQTMNLVAETQKMFSQIASVLARDAGDECFFARGHLDHHSKF